MPNRNERAMHTSPIAIVTGAGSGLGRATLAQLRQLGATVEAWDKNEHTLATLPADEHVRTHVVDITDESHVSTAASEAISHHRAIDFVVNCRRLSLCLPRRNNHRPDPKTPRPQHHRTHPRYPSTHTSTTRITRFHRQCRQHRGTQTNSQQLALRSLESRTCPTHTMLGPRTRPRRHTRQRHRARSHSNITVPQRRHDRSTRERTP